MSDPARRRVAGVGALVALVGLLLAGCVPSTGAVHRSARSAEEGPLAALGIRVLAQPPEPGAAPERLLRQFLLACADPNDDFAVARTYLAPGDDRRWRPEAGVRVYDGNPEDLTLSRTGNRLTATAPATVATISHGNYTLVSGPRTTSLTVSLARVDGQWRFRDMPDGLLLASALLFAYKPVDVFFLAPGGRRVVPDRVFLLASRADLPDAAMRALLRGPSPAMSGAVYSALPATARLRSPPTLRGGELSVDLVTGRSAVDRSPVDRPAVAAQVLWTASQLPEITGVRLRIDGAAYTSGSVGLLRASPDALAYNPNVLTSTAPAYYVTPGRGRSLLTASDGRTWRLSGGGLALRHPAVAVDGSTVAALACVGGPCRALYLGSPARELVRAGVPVRGSLTPPSWDTVGGGAWTVDVVPGRAPNVWRVSPDGTAARVEAAALGRDRVRVLRLSRDGTRVAAIVDRGGRRTVLVGVVLREGNRVRLARFRATAPTLVAAADLDWADAGHLAVLAKSDAGQGSVTPYRIRTDGSETPQPVLGTVPGGQPVAIAAAPAQSLLVATARAGGGAGTSVSMLEGQVWRPIAPTGTDPTYPG